MISYWVRIFNNAPCIHLNKKAFKFSVRNYVKYLTAVKAINEKTINRIINFQKIHRTNNV